MFSLSFASANDLENKYTAIPWEPDLAMVDYTGWKPYFTFHLFIIHIPPVPEVPTVMHPAQTQWAVRVLELAISAWDERRQMEPERQRSMRR